jgi:hypothetical protein
MAEAYKSRVHQLLQDGLKSTKSYLVEHVDARSLVEQAQRNVRDLARKAEHRLHEAATRRESPHVSEYHSYSLAITCSFTLF